MSAGLADAIRAVVQDKGIPEDLIINVIEEFLLAAYKRKYGHADNAVVQFSDDESEVTLFAQKKIVEDIDDDTTEIALEEALELNEACELGDELLIEINPQEFDRVAIQSAKQKARQRLREIQKDTLYSEFSDKVGELVIGYIQRERNGNIFLDLGKTEGIMPKRYQSPREVYRTNDRIKALIVDVAKGNAGLQIVLSRTHTELVKRIFELEVPEIYGQTVEIVRIVREAGYRTKIAVSSNREDVDPVGACVGMRGVRIQAIVRELEGEKIDILKYDHDPRVLIKNALSPADVTSVVILDEARRQALAIVPEDQLSLAIGKQGLNVRLANRLADWNIDVKTMDQFDEMDIAAESKRAVTALFASDRSVEEEITTVGELPGIDTETVRLLEAHDISYIEDVVAMSDEDLIAIEGMTKDRVSELSRIIAETVEIVEQEEVYEEEDEELEGDDEIVEDSEENVEGDEGEESETSDENLGESPAAEEIADDVDTEEEEESDEEIIDDIADLPGITPAIVEKLAADGIGDLQALISRSTKQIVSIETFTEEERETMRTILTEFIEVIEDDEDDEEDE